MDAGGDAGSSPDGGPLVDGGGGDSGVTVDGGGSPGDLPLIPSAAGPCPPIVHDDWTTLPTESGSARVWFTYMDGAGTEGDRALAIAWTPPGGSPPNTVRGSFQSEGGVIAQAERLGDWWGTEYVEVADAIVACAIERLGVSPRRIHSVGLSRGGSMVRILASQRTRYIASIAVFSSGDQAGVGAPLERPDNLFPALLAYGSDPADQPFRDLTIAYRDELSAAGHPIIECTHGMGHRYPWEMGPATARFFLDHPFGTRPTPYTGGLPSELPSYCHVYP